jgi:hypothetical protein
MIVRSGNRFRLMTHDGARALGPWTTLERARAQERAVQAHKHAVRRNPASSAGKVWYHGGPKLEYLDAIRWDRERGEDGNAAGPGMYWTVDPQEASRYGQHLYRATAKRGFRVMPKRRPTMAFVRSLFDAAPPEDRSMFLEDWADRSAGEALAAYAREETMLGAAVMLYHDLFRYDAAAYVAAMRTHYDGVRAGQDDRHLVVWSPEKLVIAEVPRR